MINRRLAASVLLLVAFCLSACNVVRTNSPEDTWKRLSIKGLFAFHDGDFDEAESCITQAYNLAFERPMCSMYRLTALSNLAFFDLYCMHYSKAAEEYERLIFMLKHNSIGHGYLIFAQYKLASIYARQNDLDKAERLWLDAIATARTEEKEFPWKVPFCQYKYATFLNRKGRLKQALPIYIQILAELQAMNWQAKEYDWLWKSTMIDLAEAYVKEGQTGQAVRTFEDAVNRLQGGQKLPVADEYISLLRSHNLSAQAERIDTLVANLRKQEELKGNANQFFRHLLSPGRKFAIPRDQLAL